MDRVRDPRIWEAFLKMWISELRFRAIEPEFLAVEPAKRCRLNKQTNKCREFLGGDSNDESSPGTSREVACDCPGDR